MTETDGVAHGLGRRAVGDHAVGHRAVELVEVAELVEGGGDLGVGQVGHRSPLAYAPAMDGSVWVDPADLQRGREPRGRRGRRPRRRSRRRTCSSSTTTRPTAPASSPTRCGADPRRGPAPPGQGGLGRAYVGRLRARAARAAPSYVVEMDADLSHDPADLPRLLARRARRRRPRARLALRAPAAASRTGTCSGACISRAGCALRAPRARRRRARPHRRLQVLPRRDAARDRLRDACAAGLRVPGRADLARARARPARRRGADPLPRAPARASRRCPRGSRSRRPGAFRRCARGRGGWRLRLGEPGPCRSTET